MSNLPLADFLAAREGHPWTAEDTAYVLRTMRLVDELATRLVERARNGR